MDGHGNRYAMKKWEKLGQEAVSNMVQRKVWMEKLTETDNWRQVRILYEGEVEGKQPRQRPRKTWADNLLLKNCFFPHCSKRYFYPCSGQPLWVTLICLTSNKNLAFTGWHHSMPLNTVTNRCPFWTLIARCGNALSFRLYMLFFYPVCKDKVLWSIGKLH